VGDRVGSTSQLRAFRGLLDRVERGESIAHIIQQANGLSIPESWIEALKDAAKSASGVGYAQRSEDRGQAKTIGPSSPWFVRSAFENGMPASPPAYGSIASAKSAIALEASAHPRGAPKGTLVDVGAGFGQFFSEGSNHPQGSLLATGPDGQVHAVINGFYLRYVAPCAELGGAPLYEALGRPTESEHSVDPSKPELGTVQAFEHGRLFWDAHKGVTIDPPELPKKTSAERTPVAPARSDVSLADVVTSLQKHYRALTAMKRRDNSEGFTREDLEVFALERSLPALVRNAARSLIEHPELLGALDRGKGITLQTLDRALLATFLIPHRFDEGGHEAVFRAWGLAQVEGNAHLGAVYKAIEALMKSDQAPKTVGELLTKTRAFAVGTLKNDPLFPEDAHAGEHLIMLTALVALAAHGLQNKWGPASPLFPVYISDGRPNDAGCDKTWHCVNQAMYAFTTQFDAKYGDGRLKQAFEAEIEHADQWGAAAHVGRAYDQSKGAVGGMMPGTLPGPRGEKTTYFERPSGLKPQEARAYDFAVRAGDAHEYFPVFGDPARIGQNHFAHDPLAEVDATFNKLSTLLEAGVSRDLTANRVGAWLGIMAFREPSAFPQLPFDEGRDYAGQTYRAGQSIPFDHYLGYELFMLDQIAVKSADTKQAIEAQRTHVEQLGPKPSAEELTQRLNDLVDQLAAGDRDRLARFYAGFSVRYLQYGWRVAIDGEEIMWKPHYDWAMSAAPDVLKQQFFRRIQATARVFDPPLELAL
jgi:hypothetical protein